MGVLDVVAAVVALAAVVAHAARLQALAVLFLAVRFLAVAALLQGLLLLLLLVPQAQLRVLNHVAAPYTGARLGRARLDVFQTVAVALCAFIIFATAFEFFLEEKSWLVGLKLVWQTGAPIFFMGVGGRENSQRITERRKRGLDVAFPGGATLSVKKG